MNLDTFKRNNVTLAGNQPSARSIIFAHGFGSDQTVWRFVQKGFEEDYRLVLYDNVGAGNSAIEAYHPVRYNSLYPYANDLLDICEELALQQPILIAHSVSCMIGVRASMIIPRIFSKMAFIGASPRYLNDDGYHGGFEQSDLDALYTSMHRNFYAWVSGYAPVAMRNEEQPDLAREFAKTLSAIRPDIAQAVARMIFQSDHRRHLAEIDTDTLILQTSDDIAVPKAVGTFLHQHISNSKLIQVHATGHLPQLSAPKEIISAIQSFL